MFVLDHAKITSTEEEQWQPKKEVCQCVTDCEFLYVCVLVFLYLCLHQVNVCVCEHKTEGRRLMHACLCVSGK